ncbi:MULTISPECIES: terminase large subunit domain-containing protein [Halorhodospira]|uniref:terminase large subunit domain-containing protein n=1 Tax=Halorhodospira TaxID=85108 RepID=UPI001EE84648|nr:MULTISPECIES: terminase family protein [Halorhodospira]MCG5527347.1 terminase family protein [Halorhodospira halophila]MCG5543659.1 terminase family protein [Halorhodospira sp. 9628]
MTAPARVDPITALTDDALLAPMLPGVHDGTWDAWLAVVKALYALPMSDDERATVRKLTGREPPTEALRAALALCGRRAGKTAISAALTLYETALRDWEGFGSPGERIVGAMVAADKRQASQALRYIRGGLEKSPLLSSLVERELSESIELNNGTEITVMTASHRTIRGRSFAVLVADELCHWHQDGASPDAEVLRAAEPALSLTDGLLLMISTPHKRDGAAYRRWKRHHGKEGAPLLSVQAESRVLNPNLSQSVVDEALAEDEAAARAEYLAEWRDDVASFLPRPMIEAVVPDGVTERPKESGVKYRAGVDVSGGANDSFTWAVAHTTDDGVDVLDMVREVKPPFSPQAVVSQCARDLARYGVREVKGDRYGAEWIREAFTRAGIRYITAEQNRSELYLDLLPRIAGQKADLLDNERLVNQLCNLERRARSNGPDSVDHPRAGADDVANAAAQALIWKKGTKRAGVF